MMEGRCIDLDNGTRLHALERAGGGTPVVLLHGVTDNARTYLPLADRLVPGRALHALDFRGHGESGGRDGPFTTDAYADDVRAFVRALDAGPVQLAGHSLGGLVAVQVAATAPELVERIFLEDAPLYFVNHLDGTYRALFEGTLEIARTLRDGSRSKEAWRATLAEMPDPFTGRPGIEVMGEEGLRFRVDSIAMMEPQVLVELLAGALEWDTDAVVARLRCPVHMVTGDPELGGVMTPEDSARVCGMVPEARVRRIDDVGHLIHLQRPEVYVEALEAWAAG